MKNNEHLNEFIMLAHMARDVATLLEKAYQRAAAEGAPTSDHAQHDMSRFIAGAHAVGAMADAVKEYQHEHPFERAWLRDCLLNVTNEVQLEDFKRHVKKNKKELKISDYHVEVIQSLTMETVQEF
jgi:hypothetical protein